MWLGGYNKKCNNYYLTQLSTSYVFKLRFKIPFIVTTYFILYFFINSANIYMFGRKLWEDNKSEALSTVL